MSLCSVIPRPKLPTPARWRLFADHEVEAEVLRARAAVALGHGHAEEAAAPGRREDLARHDARRAPTRRSGPPRRPPRARGTCESSRGSLRGRPRTGCAACADPTGRRSARQAGAAAAQRIAGLGQQQLHVLDAPLAKAALAVAQVQLPQPPEALVVAELGEALARPRGSARASAASVGRVVRGDVLEVRPGASRSRARRVRAITSSEGRQPPGKMCVLMKLLAGLLDLVGAVLDHDRLQQHRAVVARAAPSSGGRTSGSTASRRPRSSRSRRACRSVPAQLAVVLAAAPSRGPAGPPARTRSRRVGVLLARRSSWSSRGSRSARRRARRSRPSRCRSRARGPRGRARASRRSRSSFASDASSSVASGDSKTAHEYIIVAVEEQREELVAEVVVRGDPLARAPGRVAREPARPALRPGPAPARARAAGGRARATLRAAMRVSATRSSHSHSAVDVGLAEPDAAAQQLAVEARRAHLASRRAAGARRRRWPKHEPLAAPSTQLELAAARCARSSRSTSRRGEAVASGRRDRCARRRGARMPAQPRSAGARLARARPVARRPSAALPGGGGRRRRAGAGAARGRRCARGSAPSAAGSARAARRSSRGAQLAAAQRQRRVEHARAAAVARSTRCAPTGARRARSGASRRCGPCPSAARRAAASAKLPAHHAPCCRGRAARRRPARRRGSRPTACS